MKTRQAQRGYFALPLDYAPDFLVLLKRTMLANISVGGVEILRGG